MRKRYTAAPRIHGMKPKNRSVAITPEAHARIQEAADKKGYTMIDYVDKLVGIKR